MSKSTIYPRRWEEVNVFTQRLRVPGGWVIEVTKMGYTATTGTLCFLSDPKHRWKLEEKQCAC